MKVQSTERKRAGFSLAELMVVIVIIGLLATMVVPNVIARLKKSQTGVAKADIVTVDQAITNFVIENSGKYPDSLEQLIEKDASGSSYLDRTTLPQDPWGNEYIYEPPFGSQGYRLYTLGSDGAVGGEGDAQDMDIQQIKNKEV